VIRIGAFEEEPVVAPLDVCVAVRSQLLFAPPGKQRPVFAGRVPLLGLFN
jgi:hypothetical protein